MTYDITYSIKKRRITAYVTRPLGLKNGLRSFLDEKKTHLYKCVYISHNKLFCNAT